MSLNEAEAQKEAEEGPYKLWTGIGQGFTSACSGFTSWSSAAL